MPTFNARSQHTAARRRQAPPISACSQNPEALTAGCGGKAIVAADQIQTLRVFAGGRQRGRQLQRVGSAQWMKAKQPDGAPANLVQGFDLDPTRGQQPELVHRPVKPVTLQVVFALQAVQSRCAFDAASPPRYDHRILTDRPSSLAASRLVHDERHQSRGIPVLQPRVRRSSTMISLATAPPVSRTAGTSRKCSTSRGARGGAATPRFRSSTTACSSSGPSTRQGSIRATGRPR